MQKIIPKRNTKNAANQLNLCVLLLAKPMMVKTIASITPTKQRKDKSKSVPALKNILFY